LARSCGYREGTVLLVYKSPDSDLLRIKEVTTKQQALAFVSKQTLSAR
jgi:hypothetical protein